MSFLDKILLLFRMAYRGSIRRKRRSLIVAATAVVGVFCVVASQGFINGMFDSMVLVAVETGLGHAQIRPSGYLDSRQTGLELTGARKLEARFAGGLPGGVRYAARMEREAILRIGGETRGVVLLGIEPDREGGVSSMPRWVVKGEFLKQAARRRAGASCLLGGENARKLELDVHDYVIVTTGGRQGDTHTFRCRITGVFNSPSTALDERLVLMHREELSRIRNAGGDNEVSYFVFHGKALTQAAGIKQTLLGLLPGAKLDIATFFEMEPGIARLFELYDQITVFFYFIILAGFGLVLFESVTMSIFERTHEIGIIHALGARPSFLFWLVMMEAYLVTLVGVLVGIALGGVAVLILNLTGVNLTGLDMGAQAAGSGVGMVHPYLTWVDPFVALGTATVIGFISGILPALKAVRLSPVDAIYDR